MKGVFKRIGGSAVPAGNTAREALFAIPDGGKFMADFRGVRNVEQHNLFFALVDMVAETTGKTREATRRWLMMKTGYVDMLWLPDETLRIDPISIATESMAQAEFNNLFHGALNAIEDLLGTAPREVIQRLNDLLDPETRADTSRRLPKMVAPSLVPSLNPTRSKVDG